MNRNTPSIRDIRKSPPRNKVGSTENNGRRPPRVFAGASVEDGGEGNPARFYSMFRTEDRWRGLALQ